MTVTGPLGVILGLIWLVWALATIVPTLAVLVRRLHDTDRSGFWIFIGPIPLVGPVILLVFTVQASRPGGARFDH